MGANKKGVNETIPTPRNNWWWLGAIIPLSACSLTTHTTCAYHIFIVLLPLIYKEATNITFFPYVNRKGTADVYTLVTNVTRSTSLLLGLDEITLALKIDQQILVESRYGITTIRCVIAQKNAVPCSYTFRRFSVSTSRIIKLSHSYAIPHTDIALRTDHIQGVSRL